MALYVGMCIRLVYVCRIVGVYVHVYMNGTPFSYLVCPKREQSGVMVNFAKRGKEADEVMPSHYGTFMLAVAQPIVS